MNGTSTSPSVLERSFTVAIAIVIAGGILWLAIEWSELQLALIAGGLLLILEYVAVAAAWKRGLPRLFSRRALRFYLWLLVVAVAVVVRFTADTRIAVVLSTLTLVVQVLIAILAWNYWRGFFTWRRFRFVFWLFVGAVSLVVLFYMEESWRGRRAWAALKRETAARGESLELSSLIPPAIPDDQNFAAAPGIPALLGFATTDSLTNTSSRSPFWLAQAWNPLPRANWALQQATDLSEWQKYFRAHAGTNSLEEMTSWDAQPLFPVASEPQSPAADVLLALSRFEPNLELLRAASQRRSARFPFDYTQGWWVNDGGCFARLWHAVQVLSLRASAELKLNQPDAAFQDVLLALRLTQALRHEPPLARVQRGEMCFNCLQPIWEGMAAHQWTEPQLTAFQESLTHFGSLGDWERYQQGEMLSTIYLIDQWEAYANGQPSRVFQPFPRRPRFVSYLLWFAKTTYPTGWMYQDRVHVYRFFKQYSDAVKNGKCLTPADPRLGPQRITDPVFCLAVLPRVRQLGEESMGGAFFYHHASFAGQAACALERYRLAHGQYPETLEALVPDYLKPITANDRAAVRYQKANAGFVLGSESLLPDQTPFSFPKWQQGKWTWTVPASR